MGALRKWLRSEPAKPPVNPACSVDALRLLTLELLADCMPHDEGRLRAQVAHARNAQQLWLMRCDIYQAIARRHCEAEAVRRINGLLPAFEGSLPRAALTPL